jgi:hypothetical protein
MPSFPFIPLIPKQALREAGSLKKIEGDPLRSRPEKVEMTKFVGGKISMKRICFIRQMKSDVRSAGVPESVVGRSGLKRPYCRKLH